MTIKQQWFDFDYHKSFEDVGINIDAAFSNASNRNTHFYPDPYRKDNVGSTARSTQRILSDVTLSSELAGFSDQSKMLSEGEIGLVKNDNGSVWAIQIIDSKSRVHGDPVNGVLVSYRQIYDAYIENPQRNSSTPTGLAGGSNSNIINGNNNVIVNGDQIVVNNVLSYQNVSFRISGTAMADDLKGSVEQALAEFLVGGDGNDVLTGFRGADVLSGGNGDDDLYGNQGFDKLIGAAGEDKLYGGKDADILYGNLGSDYLYGNLADDSMYGGKDNDWMHGGQGDDELYGNKGVDDIYGGKGNDWFHGGQGDDVLYGNAGRDCFCLSEGTDKVMDFNASDGDWISMAAGTSYNLSQQGADLLVKADLGSLLLMNISQDSFDSSAIII
ncbi:calcium-binding protein [Prochlorococcus marinus]|uniref:calcium-binding protein n=1 Tax=Prochlorococcus TaxID=1218 RepID=UPI001F3BA5FF|nr:calcium-binding protein [Prochlorococcus marinus]